MAYAVSGSVSVNTAHFNATVLSVLRDMLQEKPAPHIIRHDNGLGWKFEFSPRENDLIRDSYHRAGTEHVAAADGDHEADVLLRGRSASSHHHNRTLGGSSSGAHSRSSESLDERDDIAR